MMLPYLEGPSPTQILREESNVVASLLAHDGGEDQEFVAIECDPVVTQVGDRIAIYEAGTKRGIVALADVHTSPGADDGAGAHAWAMLRELGEPTSRDSLVDAGLGSAVNRARRTANLREDEQAKLAELLAPLPPFRFSAQSPPGKSPFLRIVEIDEETELWQSEKEMQLALAGDEAVELLGLPVPPQIEKRFEGGRFRFDLAGPGVIVECKLFATLESLNQLQGYLDARRDTEPNTTWRGHLVAAYGYDRELVMAITKLAEAAGQAQPEVQLWICLKRPSGGVALEPQSAARMSPATLRGAILNLLKMFVLSLRQLVVDAGDLAVEGGVDPSELQALEEAANQDQDEDPQSDADESGLDDGAGANDTARAAYVEISGLVRVTFGCLFEMAEEAGATVEELEQLADDAVEADDMEPPPSMVDTLARTLDMTTEARLALYQYGHLCGLNGNKMRELIALGEDIVPEDLPELQLNWIDAMGLLNSVWDATIRLGFAAGLNEDEVAGAANEMRT